MTCFVGLRAKTYSYLIEGNKGKKIKKKKAQKVCQKRKLKFKIYKNYF